MLLLCALAAAIGLLAGGAAYPLVHAIALLTNLALFGRVGWELRASFTAIVFLFELTRDYEIILPLMLASVLADIVAARLLGGDSLSTEKLTRRGIRVGSDYEADVLTTTTVGEVMTCPVQTLHVGVTIAEAARHLAGAHSAYPLMDGPTCVGIVTRSDILREDASADMVVQPTDQRDVIAVSPRDTVLVALQRMLDENVDHLPVLDDHGSLVGICTRTDILRARHRHLAREQREPGWLSPMFRRPTPQAAEQVRA